MVNYHPSVFRDLGTQYIHGTPQPEPSSSTSSVSSVPVENRVFRAHFKLSPLGVAKVWFKMDEALRDTDCVYHTNEDPPQVVSWDNTALPQHLLWALYYMKSYQPEDHVAAWFGTSNKTFRKYFWAMVFFLNNLCDDLVSTIICCCVLTNRIQD